MATQGERRAETRQRLLDAAADAVRRAGHRGSLGRRHRGARRPHLRSDLRPLRRQGGPPLRPARGLGRRRRRRSSAPSWPPPPRSTSGWPRSGATSPTRPPATTAGSGSSTSCGPTPPATSAPASTSPRRYQRLGQRRRRGGGVGRRRRSPRPEAPVGAAVIGVLLGLEMMRRVDPPPSTDDIAIAALRGASPPRSSSRRLPDDRDRPTLDGIDLLAATWGRGVPHDQFDRLRAEAPVFWHPERGRHRVLGAHQARRRARR